MPVPLGIVDRSDRGKLAVSGEEARAALNGVVTNEVEGLEPGTGVLAAALTPKGKMLGDLRVLETGDDLLLDMERAALQPVFDAVRHGLVGYRAELHKRTLQRGLLSLVGDGARAAAGATDLPRTEHAHAPARIADAPVRVIATDLGVDVLCDAQDTRRVHEALVAGGAAELSPVPPMSCASSRVARGTASTSTTASSPRRPASTIAR